MQSKNIGLKKGCENMTVAEKIKLYLVEHKIKQSVVSDETGINKDKLCLSLNGKRKLSSDEFSRIV